MPLASRLKNEEFSSFAVSSLQVFIKVSGGFVLGCGDFFAKESELKKPRK